VANTVSRVGATYTFWVGVLAHAVSRRTAPLLQNAYRDMGLTGFESEDKRQDTYYNSARSAGVERHVGLEAGVPASPRQPRTRRLSFFSCARGGPDPFAAAPHTRDGEDP
jgi:hypothetical protein